MESGMFAFRLALYAIIVLAGAAFEAFSIFMMWKGSFHWAAIFAIITALNVRVVAYNQDKLKRKLRL